jgi:hypothetical protein
MAIVTTAGRDIDVLTLNYAADGDLSGLQYCAVVASGASTGLMKVKAPTGAGLIAVGILQNAPTDGLQAAVRVEGVCKAKAYGTFDSGAELQVADTTGRLTTASTADFVVAIAEEASSVTNQYCTVRLVSPYQKNA